MKKYSTIYFDLDNTLLDFHSSEYKAIKALLVKHSLPNGDEQARLYSEINLQFWEKFERGEIEKKEIFVGRFEAFLKTLGLSGNPIKMSQDYFQFLSAGHDLIDGANEILLYLKNKRYYLCATTNGIAMTQYKRISEAGIGQYFDFIAVSEEAGHQKPEKEYFDFVLSKTPEKDISKILIIGDSQSSDILGGINSGIDTCWFNSKLAPAKYTSQYEIQALVQLKDLL